MSLLDPVEVRRRMETAPLCMKGSQTRQLAQQLQPKLNRRDDKARLISGAVQYEHPRIAALTFRSRVAVRSIRPGKVGDLTPAAQQRAVLPLLECR